MSDLFDAFDDALAPRLVTSAARAEQVVAVVEHRVRVRRRTRAVGVAAMSTLTVGAVAAGAMVLSPLGSGTSNGPAAATSPTGAVDGSPDPSDGPTSEVPEAVQMWTEVEPGSFLIAQPAIVADDAATAGSQDGAVTELIMLPPDGIAAFVGQISDANVTLQGWGESGVLFTELAPQPQLRWWEGASGAFIEAAAVPTRGDVVALIGDGAVTRRVVTDAAEQGGGGAATDFQDVVYQLDLVAPDGTTELCRTADSSGGAAMVSPNGKTAVCFDPVGAESTDVVVAQIGSEPDAEVLMNFTHAASEYTRVGWLNDTQMIFARQVGAGYRYFKLDLQAKAWSDTFLPGDLDGTLPQLDQETGSYVVASWAKATVYDADGTVIGEASCTREVPEVVIASQRALVSCVDGSDLTLQLLDLETGQLIDTGRGLSLENFTVDASGDRQLQIVAYDPR